jgi:ATP phosphoribosyltransferase
MRYMIVRATDVPTYVEYGSADLGIVGKDTLLEQGKDVYEPLDLKFGYCRMMVAEPANLAKNDDPSGWSHIRIATKYPHVTSYFAMGIRSKSSLTVDGAGAAVGLAERRSGFTGETMRQNGPGVSIAEITTRLIVPASLKTKHARISAIIRV